MTLNIHLELPETAETEESHSVSEHESSFRMHFPAFQNRTLKRYSARWLTSYLRKGFPAFLAHSPAISYIPYRTTAGKS